MTFTLKDYEMFSKITAIGNIAVQKAQEENHRLGLPNVYANDKGLYFELPDGTITMENPLCKR